MLTILKKEYFLFKKLPKEIQIIIFDFLVKSNPHGNYGLVCKDWYSLFNAIHYINSPPIYKIPLNSFNSLSKIILKKSILLTELNRSYPIHEDTLYKFVGFYLTIEELDTIVWRNCILKIVCPTIWNKNVSYEENPGFYTHFHVSRGFRIKDIYYAAMKIISDSLCPIHIQFIKNRVDKLSKKDSSWKELNLNILDTKRSRISLLTQYTCNLDSIRMNITLLNNIFYIVFQECNE